MRKIIKKMLIWATIGLVFTIGMLYLLNKETILDFADVAEMLIFWPIYFVGLGFANWRIIGKIYLGIFAVQTLNWRDRYHILTTSAGAMVFAYIVIFGWVVGFIRLFILIAKYFYQRRHGTTATS